MTKDIFDRGMGHVVVARHKPGGRFEAGVFLVDTYCLGVKDAFYTDSTKVESIEELLGKIFPPDDRKEIPGSHGRKLVEQAVAYARRLGLAPCRDYHKGARVFGGLRAEDCAEEFEFGKDGMPFYIQGPHESAATADRILAILRSKVGQENFHFLVNLGNPGEPGGTAGRGDDEFNEEAGDMLPPGPAAVEYPMGEDDGPSGELVAFIREFQGASRVQEQIPARPELSGHAGRFFYTACCQLINGTDEKILSDYIPEEYMPAVIDAILAVIASMWNSIATGMPEKKLFNKLPGGVLNALRAIRSSVVFDDLKDIFQQYYEAVPQVFFIQHMRWLDAGDGKPARLMMILQVMEE